MFYAIISSTVADNGIPPPSYRTINVEVHCEYILFYFFLYFFLAKAEAEYHWMGIYYMDGNIH
jgi:hypothetical protein